MKVKIKDYEFEITETNDKDDKEFWDKEQDHLILFGNCNFVDCEIKVWKDLSPIQKRKTLTHELTHAFLFAYWSSYNIKERYDNEDVCCFMETFAKDIFEIVENYFDYSAMNKYIEKVEEVETSYSLSKAKGKIKKKE